MGMTNEEALEVINRLGLDARGYPTLKEAKEKAREQINKVESEE